MNRINKKIPAVTKVDECTNADTGVGAAIAAGNQMENGIWALFVIIIIKNINFKINLLNIIFNKFHDPQFIIKKIIISNIISPIRLVNKVNIPEFNDNVFW